MAAVYWLGWLVLHVRRCTAPWINLYIIIKTKLSFVKGCKIIQDDILATLSLLFIIYPDKIKKSEIIIPYYIAFLDDQKNIIDIQYYKAIANLNKNSEDSVFIETEANIIIDIKFSLNNINDEFSNDILVGFMLDEKKVNIIN